MGRGVVVRADQREAAEEQAVAYFKAGNGLHDEAGDSGFKAVAAFDRQSLLATLRARRLPEPQVCKMAEVKVMIQVEGAPVLLGEFVFSRHRDILVPMMERTTRRSAPARD